MGLRQLRRARASFLCGLKRRLGPVERQQRYGRVQERQRNFGRQFLRPFEWLQRLRVSPHRLQRDSKTELDAGIAGILSGGRTEKVDRLSRIACAQYLQAPIAQRRGGLRAVRGCRGIRRVYGHGFPAGFIGDARLFRAAHVAGRGHRADWRDGSVTDNRTRKQFVMSLFYLSLKASEPILAKGESR